MRQPAVEVQVRGLPAMRLKCPEFTGHPVVDGFERAHFELEVMQRRVNAAEWAAARESLGRVITTLDEVLALQPRAL